LRVLAKKAAAGDALVAALQSDIPLRHKFLVREIDRSFADVNGREQLARAHVLESLLDEIHELPIRQEFLHSVRVISPDIDDGNHAVAIRFTLETKSRFDVSGRTKGCGRLKKKNEVRVETILLDFPDRMLHHRESECGIGCKIRRAKKRNFGSEIFRGFRDFRVLRGNYDAVHQTARFRSLNRPCEKGLSLKGSKVLPRYAFGASAGRNHGQNTHEDYGIESTSGIVNDNPFMSFGVP
jgi:hypothetical protein